MTEYEKLIQFSEKAEAKKNGRMTVVEVAKGGSCIIRNMETHDGIVNMIRSYCIYENGKLKQSSEVVLQDRIMGIYRRRTFDVFRSVSL